MEYLNQRYRMQQEQDLLQTVQEMEAAVTHLRQFAATALRVSAMGAMAESKATTIASVKLTEEGWLVISLPVMLPHRGEKDPARFLDEPLRSAIRDYFCDKPLPKFRDCVLVYEQIYDAAYPRRRVTDHDNLELKHCQDVLEAAFLTNDTALLCSAFLCSHMGKNPGTRIWILTPEQFPKWLCAHKNAWENSQNMEI